VQVELAYGRTGLSLDVPDDATVVTPSDAAGIVNEADAILAALRDPTAGPPLAQLIGPRDHVAVVFPDLTRPMPNTTVLPPLLAELDRLGVGPDRVELLCATGTHRQASTEEMIELVGPDIASSYRIHDHDADDGRHVSVGRVDGVPILLDAHYVSAPVRIVTGFVEPHFFAGFSGGPKGVCPGLAGTETILEAHSPARIANPDATWTRIEGNPVHDFVRAAVAFHPPTFSIDVAINRNRQLTAVFSGSMKEAHSAACRYVERTVVQSVPGAFDVVLSTNGGYPLDRNLYQAVKGMAAAERVVRDGGAIVLAAQCLDGMPEGAFAKLLEEATTAADLLRGDAISRQDRWQVQVLGRVLARAEVWLHADGLSDEQVRSAHLRPAPDLVATLERSLAAAGPGARLCVLPQGPLTVATSR
jgi:nickel-dependent lactate racemase